MKIQNINRRDFIKMAAGGAGGLAAASLLAPGRAAVAGPLEKARESIDDLRITDMKLLRLRFPGKVPLMPIRLT